MNELIKAFKEFSEENDRYYNQLRFIDLVSAEYYRGRRDAFGEIADALDKYFYCKHENIISNSAGWYCPNCGKRGV